MSNLISGVYSSAMKIISNNHDQLHGGAATFVDFRDNPLGYEQLVEAINDAAVAHRIIVRWSVSDSRMDRMVHDLGRMVGKRFAVSMDEFTNILEAVVISAERDLSTCSANC